MVSLLNPDVLLMDWHLALREGMNILSEVRRSGASINIILVSAPSDTRNLSQYIQLGVKGILLGDATAETLRDAIHEVMAGQYVLGNAAVASLVRAASAPTPSTAFQVAKRKFGITPREFEFISEVVAGWSTADIVQRTSVSPNTLKHHMTHIFDKLGVSNRVELVLFAVKHIFSSEAASD
jgi:DNA-binding NarL/FixJ family response regulator